MSRKLGVPEVSGPLGPWADGYAAWLSGRGYAALTVKRGLRDLARLSRWLDREGLGAGELTGKRADEFLRAQQAAGYRTLTTPGRLRRPLEFLREVGAAPVEEPRATADPVEELLSRYRRYLIQERGLATTTIAGYESEARLFLADLGGPAELKLERLGAGDVIGYVARMCPLRGAARARGLVVALRSLLRYLHLTGVTATALQGAVPAVADRRSRSLPKGLDPEVLERLLVSCDRQRAIGLRNYAILLLLARLGLRAGEVAALEIEDVDWRRGELLVRGKGPRLDTLPLPGDVGQALADHLRRPRPQTECRALFLRGAAPIGPISREVVGWVVRDACVRAGVPPVGPHRLRHTAATAMLRAGSSLAEIGEVLRHRDIGTTAIYAKVDHRALRAIAGPWPGDLA